MLGDIQDKNIQNVGYILQLYCYLKTIKSFCKIKLACRN